VAVHIALSELFVPIPAPIEKKPPKACHLFLPACVQQN